MSPATSDYILLCPTVLIGSRLQAQTLHNRPHTRSTGSLTDLRCIVGRREHAYTVLVILEPVIKPLLVQIDIFYFVPADDYVMVIESSQWNETPEIWRHNVQMMSSEWQAASREHFAKKCFWYMHFIRISLGSFLTGLNCFKKTDPPITTNWWVAALLLENN